MNFARAARRAGDASGTHITAKLDPGVGRELITVGRRRRANDYRLRALSAEPCVGRTTAANRVVGGEVLDYMDDAELIVFGYSLIQLFDLFIRNVGNTL